MAFCLEELYRQTAPDHQLIVDAYDALGRLRGVISRRAAALLEELREIKGANLDATLPRVFHALVHVDAAGTATRRRAFRDELDATSQTRVIINKLIQGRLLTAADADDRATVTLAHEALLLEWPALHDWLDCHRTQLQRVQTLIAALSDGAWRVRSSAASALGQIGLVTAEVLPALITALQDDDKEVRRSVAMALEQLGPAAVPALITALQDDDKEVRRRAATTLGWLGPEAASVGQLGSAAVPALITALQDNDKTVRRNSAKALRRIRLASPAANSV
jgi:HEAT repeat protein